MLVIDVEKFKNYINKLDKKSFDKSDILEMIDNQIMLSFDIKDVEYALSRLEEKEGVTNGSNR
jgi:hypothetical protein